jgi:hypothetical protein
LDVFSVFIDGGVLQLLLGLLLGLGELLEHWRLGQRGQRGQSLGC